MTVRPMPRACAQAAITLVALLVCLLAPLHARADIFRPAYLELREIDADRYAVQWRVPALDDARRLSLSVQFPPGTVDVEAPKSDFTGTAVVEHRLIQRPGGLSGQPLHFEGRALGVSDMIVRIQWLDGSSQTQRLSAEQSSLTLRAAGGTFEVASAYLVLGVGHILGGIDHLLFVLSLLLIVRGLRRIVATVTAFTLAHSVTLVAATMGWVQVPGPPVEACIALSIVFVAAEAVRALYGHSGLTEHAPWAVAFSFGLLHGLGFAGALAEVGLPPTAIPVALLMFNLGVEIGQLLFVLAVLGLVALLRSRPWPLPPWSRFAAPYGIGVVATFWLFERVTAFWS